MEHSKQILDNIACKDKAFKHAKNNDTRDKILKGAFHRSNYNDSNLCKFWNY